MLDDDKRPLRNHLGGTFELDPGEPVFLETNDVGTLNWTRKGEVPESKKTPELLRAYLRQIALETGGEAWRAVTDRGELLRVYSVYDRAKEWNGNQPITRAAFAQLCLAAARMEARLSPFC